MSARPIVPGPTRILVIANETAHGSTLHATVLAHAARGGPAQVLVVAPALNSRVRHWLSDDGAARRNAIERVTDCVEQLRGAGVAAEGVIGDPDPLLAIDDALRTFPATELIVSTHPEGRSNWLARDLVTRVRRRLDLPVTHVVVDTAPLGAHYGPAAVAA